MLIKGEIQAKGIVQDPQTDGERQSTYDATVGAILKKGRDQGAAYTLPPRGVVWVVSKEEFHMPGDVTGLATVRTTWAQQGVFALNVGVVDPGWQGPVATAIVNFSNREFKICQGDTFMRLIFLDHCDTGAATSSRPNYLDFAKLRSHDFSETFLNMDLIVDDVAEEIFKLPKVLFYIAIAGLVAAVFAIIVPLAQSAFSGGSDGKTEIIRIQQRVDSLEAVDKKRESAREAELDAALRKLESELQDLKAVKATKRELRHKQFGVE